MKFVQQIKVCMYQEELGNMPVRDWLHELSKEDRQIIGRDIKKIQIDWPVDNLLVKPLGNKLWEIRSRLDNRTSRIIFVFYDSQIILLHGFIKKTQKTPPQELDLALKRSKLLLRKKE